MDELVRTKLHEALDVEQPDAGLRARVMSSLPADGLSAPGHGRGRGVPGRRAELATGIAAVLLAAIVIGTFAYIRAFNRPHVVVPPITSASPSFVAPTSCPPYMGIPAGQACPTPLTEPLNIGSATPAILFVDAADSNQVDGLTWDGQKSGKITRIPNPAQPACQVTGTTETCSPPAVGGGAPPQNGPESSNPDGTLFVAFPYFYDRSGRVVATLQGGPYSDPAVGEYFVGTWADDKSHYCQVVPIFGGDNAVTGTLQLTTPGGKPRDVAHMGQQAAGENTLSVTTCSVLGDRAVVVQSAAGSGAQILHYWVVQLSTGKILWTHDPSGTKVVASRDGRYIAEVQPDGSSIVYGPVGLEVGHVNGAVESFSWDGSLALVVTSGGTASVVRWSDGTNIWTVPVDEGLSGFQPEPGGTRFAVMTVTGDLYVVSSAGLVLGHLHMRSSLLGCLPKQCASSSVLQVVPQLMSGSSGWGDGYEHTTDGGLNWRDVSPPNPPNVTKGGYAMYLLDPNHAWVTMATGQPKQPIATQLVVLATADGGQTWNQGGSVPVSGAAMVTNSLDFIDAQHGWMLADSGPFTWDATSSTMVNQPISRAIYATTDGGLTWSRLAKAQQGDGSTLGRLALGCPMTGLKFVNVTEGWVTWDCSSSNGGPPSPQQPATGVMAVTRDGGRSWQSVNLPALPSEINYVCGARPPVFTSSQGILPIVCAGTTTPGISGVYATSDGGRSWSFRQLPFFTQQLDFVDASTGWAFGTTGVNLYRTTDGGRNWTVVKEFTSEQRVIRFNFLDENLGFAVTSRNAAALSSGFSTLWKTTDGGRTWSVLSSIPTGGQF